MCSVFPTVTSCNIPNVGAAGGEQVHNGLCVLTQVRLQRRTYHCLVHLQNIINEKIYLVLWFWYAFLGPLSVLFVFYRLFTIFFSGIRFSLLYRTVSTFSIHVQSIPEKSRCGASMMMISERAWTMFWLRDILGTGLSSTSSLKTATLTSTESS